MSIKVKDIWTQFIRSPVRKLGFVALLVAVILGLLGYRSAEDFLSNASTELASIALTVLIIDYLNERRAEQQLKAQLIREMGGKDNGIVLRAVKELAAHGWLYDGSLERAVFEGSNLEEANLQSANLRGACFWLANLRRADFKEADLRQARLFADLQEARFDQADLRGSALNASDLRKADFFEANLQGADLHSANLQEANFNRANLRGADMFGIFLRCISADR